MAETTELGVVLLEQGQSGKETTLNEALEQFDQYTAGLLDIDVTADAGGTRNLTEEETLYKALVFSGTPVSPLTVTIPDGFKRLHAVRNESGQDILFRTVGGAGITVPTTIFSMTYSDGVDIYQAQSSIPAGIAWEQVGITHTRLTDTSHKVTIGGSAEPDARLYVEDGGALITGDAVILSVQEEDTTIFGIRLNNASAAASQYGTISYDSFGLNDDWRLSIIQQGVTDSIHLGYNDSVSGTEIDGIFMHRPENAGPNRPLFWFNRRFDIDGGIPDEQFAYNFRGILGLDDDGTFLIDGEQASGSEDLLTLRQSSDSVVSDGVGPTVKWQYRENDVPTITELGETRVTYVSSGGRALYTIAARYTGGAVTDLLTISGSSGNVEVTNGLLLGNTTAAVDGTIRWTGTDFEGRVAGTYISLTTPPGGSISIGDSIGSGTSGSVLFVDAGINLDQDNTNFFWDDTQKRLGIGINSPDRTLHVSTAVEGEPTIKVENRSSNVTGAIIEIYHDTNTTAIGDEPAIVRFAGDVASGTETQIWAEIRAEVTDANSLTADGDLVFYVIQADSLVEKVRINADGRSSYGDSFVGGFSGSVLNTTTTPLNLDSTHYTIFMDATAGAKTVVPPDAAVANNVGRIYIIKKIDATGNTVTVDPVGGDTIDGSATYVLSNQYDWVAIQSDGTNYNIISSTSGAGAGNVFNSGTPVDDQLAIWTAADTIEGQSTLRYVTGGTAKRLEVNAASPTVSPQQVGLFLGGGSGGQVSFQINSASMAHGLTSLAPTDVYFQNLIGSNFGTAVLRGFGEVSAFSGLVLQGYKVGEPTTRGALEFVGARDNGGTSVTSLASTSKIATFSNNTTNVLHIYGNGDLEILSGGDLILADGDTCQIRGTADGVTFGSSVNYPLQTGSVNVNLNDTHYVVGIDVSGGTRTATLPALSGTTAGKIYVIKKTSGGGNTLTVARTGGDTINGAASNENITAPYGYRIYIADPANTNWLLIGSN